ncbi:GTPase Era [Mycoplasmopsis hyopharyngis]|uniref:GTPase Era n=1 Tax=Mycoplasmopsis hyopharyngis TaxID=29558 RepID=UPI00387397A6
MKICFVSILGRPNTGKSSLLNNILGYNVSIVTNVAQTTRDQIVGVYNEEDYQIVFTDTPGIHKPESELGEILNKNAYSSLQETDLVLFLSPANEKIGAGDNLIIDKIKNVKNKIAVITKIDLIKDPKLILQKQEELQKIGFEQIASVSIKNNKSIDSLIKLIKTYSYESVPYYDQEAITDKSMRFIAKEILREAAINELYEELPHSIATEIEQFNEFQDHIEIHGVIYVKKASQKGMVIGNNGSKIKKIGTDARKSMSAQFGTKVNLFTKVKIANKWNDDKKTLKKFGYE